MTSITVQEILDRAREHADIVDSDFVTDTNALHWVNTSLGELYDLLVGLYEDYFVLTRTISLTAAQTYSLPVDNYKVRKLYYMDGDTRVPLHSFDLDAFSTLNYPTVNPKYRIIGNKLWFSSLPVAGTYELWYIPKVIKVTAVTDVISFELPNNTWEEFFVLSVAILMMAKEESDISVLAALKAQMKDQIIKSASQRNAGETVQARRYSRG